MKSSILLPLLALVRFVISDSTPLYGVDDNTAADCVEWYNNAGRSTCDEVLRDFGISRQDFKKMNPSVGLDCQPFGAWQSFCLITQEKLNQTSTKTTPSGTTSIVTTSTFSLGPSPTAWVSKGCYVENIKQPILEQNMSPSAGDAALSIAKCKNSCYRRAYSFAGVQAGNQCWCGSYIGGEWTKNQTDCNLPCTGDASTFCGGKGLGGGLVAGKSYCVETMGEPAPVPASTAQTSSMSSNSKPTDPSTISSAISTTTSTSSQVPATTLSKSTTTATTTKPGNGVATPQPTQPGMVTNCAKFHWIAKGVTCSQVISYQKITLADFVAWNPTVLNDCSGMWAEVNVCVGIIGGSTTTVKPTPTNPGNGVSTPQPTQPGMVTNCAKFHWVALGVVCSQITSYQQINLADFVKWNPTVRSDCSAMQANVNVCVGLIGGSPTATKPTTTTSVGNGIQTPLPTQPGMVTNCKKFHFAAQGVVCSQITSYQKISMADFLKWNIGINADCTNMWAGTQTCVGV